MNTLVIGNYNYSSWSMRGWLAVKAAELDVSIERIPLMVDGYSEAIKQYSPAGLVPALIVDDALIADSLAIAEYCAEQKPDLWPKAPLERAVARSVSAEMHSGFTTIRGTMPMNCRANDRQVEMTSALEQEIDRIESIWSSCRQRHGGNGPWLFGAMSIADIMFAPVASRFRTYGATPPSCVDYVDTVLSSSLLQEWYAHSKHETEVIAAAEVGVISQ